MMPLSSTRRRLTDALHLPGPNHLRMFGFVHFSSYSLRSFPSSRCAALHKVFNNRAGLIKSALGDDDLHGSRTASGRGTISAGSCAALLQTARRKYVDRPVGRMTLVTVMTM